MRRFLKAQKKILFIFLPGNLPKVFQTVCELEGDRWSFLDWPALLLRSMKLWENKNKLLIFKIRVQIIFRTITNVNSSPIEAFHRDCESLTFLTDDI